MKRWAVLVAILYGLMLCVLALPVVMLAFVPEADLKTVAAIYIHWQWWFILAVMGLAQAALLAVPVQVTSRRPMARIPLGLTILTAAMMMAGLFVGAFFSIYEFGFHDLGGNWTLWTALAVGATAWAAWALLFFRLSRSLEPEDLTSRLCQYLLKGSILELLIAVPTHIVARCRDYCCAGAMTFIGLTLGMSVMLFSFGPGIFFLFVARWKRLHPKRGTNAGTDDRR